MKTIEEIMGLVEQACVNRAEAALGGMLAYERISHINIQIESALRELVERKPMSDVAVQIEANEADDNDWNDLAHKKTWHEGFEEGFRSAESVHKIGA